MGPRAANVGVQGWVCRVASVGEMARCGQQQEAGPLSSSLCPAPDPTPSGRSQGHPSSCVHTLEAVPVMLGHMGHLHIQFGEVNLISEATFQD